MKEKNDKLRNPDKKDLRKKNEFPIIIVIGASAGGLNAVTEVIAQLDNSCNCAIFVVIHLSHTSVAEFLLFKIKTDRQLIKRSLF